MKFNGISISANVPISATPNHDGVGEAITIPLPGGIRLLIVSRYVSQPFWALQMPNGSPFSIQIVSENTRWRSFLKGFFHEKFCYRDSDYHYSIEIMEEHITIEIQPEAEIEYDTEYPADPEDEKIEEIPAE